MTTRSYVALNSTVGASDFSRFSRDNDDLVQQPFRLSKRIAVGATVTFIVVVMALVVCTVSPQHDMLRSNNSPLQSGTATNLQATKSDALDERLNALDYMEKKRQEDYPKKKTSLRSSSIATHGGQLDALFAKEDLSYSILIGAVQDEDGESSDDEESADSSSGNAKKEALKKHTNALGYMDKKRVEEHPKKTSLRSSTAVTKDQLDPLFAKEELETASDYINIEEEEGIEEESVDSSADDSSDENLEEHIDALAYVANKRQEEHPKKVSLRSSTAVTQGQLDPLFAKEELLDVEDFSLVEKEVKDESSDVAASEPKSEELTEEDLDEHMDALAYMDKKRQDERPKKTSLRSSSTITKEQLNPLLAKEELETATSGDHVDALAYMDQKRQEEHSKKTSVRSSSAVTKDQLDPILAKEELETVTSGEHVDALAYMDKKHQEEHPKKKCVRSSSKVTKGQLDPILAKEELETVTSNEHVDALDYMDKKRDEKKPKKTSVRSSSGQLDPILAKEELETGNSGEDHVDALAYMDKKRQEEHAKKTPVRSSTKVTKGQLDPILAKEEFVALEEDLDVNVLPDSLTTTTEVTTERRQTKEVAHSIDESPSNGENRSDEEETDSSDQDS